jgi:hypothetical protein
VPDPINSPNPDPREPDELDDASAATNKARQGVTGHNVRYVLLFSLIGVVVAFTIVYAAFFS